MTFAWKTYDGIKHCDDEVRLIMKSKLGCNNLTI